MDAKSFSIRPSSPITATSSAALSAVRSRKTRHSSSSTTKVFNRRTPRPRSRQRSQPLRPQRRRGRKRSGMSGRCSLPGNQQLRARRPGSGADLGRHHGHFALVSAAEWARLRKRHRPAFFPDSSRSASSMILVRIDQYLTQERYAHRRYTITDADGTICLPAAQRTNS